MTFTVLSDEINQEYRNSSVVTQNRYINIGRVVNSSTVLSWDVLMPVSWNINAYMLRCECLLVSFGSDFLQYNWNFLWRTANKSRLLAKFWRQETRTFA